MTRWLQYLVMFSAPFGNITFVHAQVRPDVLGSPDAIIYNMELIQEEATVVVNCGDNIQLWNYETKTLIDTWTSSRIIAIDYLNNKLAGVSKSGSIVIWNVSERKESLQVKIVESPLTCVTWIDSVFVAVGSDNGDIMKINSVSGEIVSHIKTRAVITAMGLGPDDTLIVGNSEGTLATYDSREMRLVSTVSAHKSWVREIKPSIQRQSYVTISDDGYYKMWKSGKEIVSVRRAFGGNWLLCTDFSEAEDKTFDITAFGTRNGKISVVTRFGSYTYDLNSIVNSICIIKNELPTIVVLVATHGEGLQLVSAKAMKMNKL